MNALCRWGVVVSFMAAAMSFLGCGKAEPPAPPPVVSDPNLLQAIMDAQASRMQTVNDFAIQGEVTGADERVAFSLAYAKPGHLRSTLNDGKQDFEVTFDGNALLVLDKTHNVAQRRDLTTTSAEEKLLLVQQAFGRLFVEGWRAPMLPPKKSVATNESGRETILVALDDDTLKEERFYFAADHAFDGRATFDKTGQEVAYLRVGKRDTDAATGLVFPTQWEKKDASGTTQVLVKSFKINAGVDANAFSTVPPAGVTVSQ